MEKPNIRRYTEDSYEWINAELSKNGGIPISPAIQRACQALYAELEDIRDYQDVVYRGTKILPQGLQKYQDAYQDDKPITEITFVSTSRSILKAKEYMHLTKAEGRKVLFTMVSKTGKSIEDYSKFPIEQEVLFLPNTNFRVLSFEDKGEIVLITLLEV